MKETRTFRSYNFVTGAVDGTLAYDFSESYDLPREEPLPRRREPKRARPRPAERDWVREENGERAERAGHAARRGVPVLGILCALCAGVMLVVMLLAQIQLVNISNSAAAMEQTLAELKLRQDKLTVEYETVFNLKDVEEYAVGVLGMQEPREDQIYYLTDVPSSDKAVVVSRAEPGSFSLGLEDLVRSLKAYFG